MISTVTYTGDGATRVFPVAFEIQGEDYVVIFKNDVAIANRTYYDIINNSIVFVPLQTPSNGDKLEIIVASSATEIGDLKAPPTLIQAVVDNLGQVITVSNNIDSVNTLALIDSDITSVSGIAADVSTVSASNVSVVSVASSIDNVNSVASTIIPNLAEILLADDNATIATAQAVTASAQTLIATEQANNALTSATIAAAYANLEWGGFSTLDGELIVSYADGATSLPALVDGDFIITY